MQHISQAPPRFMTPASTISSNGPRCACGNAARQGCATCWTCEEKRIEAAGKLAEAQELTADTEATVVRILRVVGFQDKHLDATLKRVPAIVSSAIPDGALASMKAGKRPPRGFGLVGTSGAGKTMAVAALVRLCIRTWLLGNVHALGRLVINNPPIQWVDWPERVDWMRDHYDRVGGFMAAALEVPLLVLDDIGAERIVGDTYERDYGSGKLDLLIHGRENRKLPTIWTSNMNEDALASRYGARLSSRLNGCSPAGSWIVAPDLRRS